jgi:CHAT domain-containing protein
VLAWAWDTVAGPVLDALGYVGPPGLVWPRLWWCPVGVLGYLPWHAVGHHADLGTRTSPACESPRTVLDRVVSSYAITIRALAHARAGRAKPSAPATIVIAVPDAPGAQRLDGVREEARLLVELVPGASEPPRPTRLGVLAALPKHSIAHFACHGLANWADPSASCLLLYDCDVAPMTAADISALRLEGGLAYLSACDTSVTSQNLIDEAVHITGAFHLAGYQQVVGSLWPVSDTVASMVAVEVYQHLTSKGTRLPEVGGTAEALHHATRHLRTRLPGLPIIWASLTHTGI